MRVRKDDFKITDYFKLFQDYFYNILDPVTYDHGRGKTRTNGISELIYSRERAFPDLRALYLSYAITSPHWSRGSGAGE